MRQAMQVGLLYTLLLLYMKLSRVVLWDHTHCRLGLQHEDQMSAEFIRCTTAHEILFK